MRTWTGNPPGVASRVCNTFRQPAQLAADEDAATEELR